MSGMAGVRDAPSTIAAEWRKSTLDKEETPEEDTWRTREAAMPIQSYNERAPNALRIQPGIPSSTKRRPAPGLERLDPAVVGLINALKTVEVRDIDSAFAAIKAGYAAAGLSCPSMVPMEYSGLNTGRRVDVEITGLTWYMAYEHVCFFGKD